MINIGPWFFFFIKLKFFLSCLSFCNLFFSLCYVENKGDLWSSPYWLDWQHAHEERTPAHEGRWLIAFTQVRCVTSLFQCLCLFMPLGRHQEISCHHFYILSPRQLVSCYSPFWTIWCRVAVVKGLKTFLALVTPDLDRRIWHTQNTFTSRLSDATFFMGRNKMAGCWLLLQSCLLSFLRGHCTETLGPGHRNLKLLDDLITARCGQLFILPKAVIWDEQKELGVSCEPHEF